MQKPADKPMSHATVRDLNHDPTHELTHTSTVTMLFSQLAGTWNLARHLSSEDDTEPSGTCSGTATFTSREPSVFVNKDGKLETAQAELLYHEQGSFAMQPRGIDLTDPPRFPFSQKYVWRLQGGSGEAHPVLSIWFTKPGTDKIDYLFHKLSIQMDKSPARGGRSHFSLQGTGGHLCVEDLYSSEYSFTFDSVHDQKAPEDARPALRTWTVTHEVRGPKKDQLIQTAFTRD